MTAKTGYDTIFGSLVRTTSNVDVVHATTDLVVTTGLIGNLVNGDFAQTAVGSVTNWSGAVSGKEIRFEFMAPRVVTKMKNTQSSSGGQGTWNFQGSLDGSSWTTLAPNISWTGPIDEQTFANTTAYLFYRLAGVSGNVNSGPWWEETEFFCSGDTIEMGDRHLDINVTSTLTLSGGANPLSNLLNGNRVSAGVAVAAQAAAGKTMTFDFVSTLVTITGFVFWAGVSAAQGVWQPQGSNDGVAWTNLGGNITLATDANRDGAAYSWTNTVGYRYFQLLGVSGNTATANQWIEFDFVGLSGGSAPFPRSMGITLS